MKIPLGTGLLLAGSGLYWILSSQLIASFTVLFPGLFRSSPEGVTLVLALGVISLSIGLSGVHHDFDELLTLAARGDGWVFLLPFYLAVLDVCLTVFGLRPGSTAVELNPFVASAVQTGSAAVVPFLISYMALSEGLALLMLDAGRRLLPTSEPSIFLPFSATCGAAALGPISNVALLFSTAGGLAYFMGPVGAALLVLLVYTHFRTLKYSGTG